MQRFDMYIGQLSVAFRLHGVYISLFNFAAIFQHGAANAGFLSEFKQGAEQPTSSNHIASEKLFTISITHKLVSYNIRKT